MAKYGRSTLGNISNLYFESARGDVDNTFVVHKFGDATDIDIGDDNVVIWDGSCDFLSGPKIVDYTFSASADITRITSSDDGDATDVEIQGLDSNWDYCSQIVTLTGQTDAILSTPLIRVTRMINVGSSDISGTVYLRTEGSTVTSGTPDDTTSVRAIIKNGDNQTAMAIYSVPRGHRMFVVHGWSTLSRKNNGIARVTISRRSFGGVFRVIHRISLNSSGTSTDHRIYTIPIVIEEKEDLIYKASVEGNNTGVAAGFHALIMKN